MGAVWIIACTRGDPPPTPEGSPSVAVPELPIPGFADAATNADSSSEAAAADPTGLPQTRDRPHASGPVFDGRVRGLWDAIVSDCPERAMPFFFPLDAYVQVKDVERPGIDWKNRLVAAFIRDIHALHRRLERQAGDPKDAKLIGMEVPEGRARWVDPGEEYNKVGYFRVFGSRVRYGIDETTHAFEVKSLISWRGSWYVVHLRAIE
ncbi:MAG: hypothetical protein ABTD50_06880 [Polyangiaceae bacterium]|jgi:hypothetical protein